MENEWQNEIDDILEGKYSDEGLNFSANSGTLTMKAESSRQEGTWDLSSNVTYPFRNFGELSFGMTHCTH